MLTEFMRKRNISSVHVHVTNCATSSIHKNVGIIPAILALVASVGFRLKNAANICLFEARERRVYLFKWGTIITILGFIFVGLNIVAMSIEYNGLSNEHNLKGTAFLENKEISKPAQMASHDSTNHYQGSNNTTANFSTIQEWSKKDLRDFSNKKMHHILSQCPRSLQPPMEFVTTLVSQTTLDRLLLMKETCQRWTSPIVVVVCVTPEELNGKWKKTEQEYSKACPHMKLIPFQVRDEYQKKFTYPINVMRNKGLDEVTTSHILMIDADFVPSVDLDKGIQRSIQLAMEQDGKASATTTTTHANHYQHHALVIPAYERKLASKKCQQDNFKACIQLTSLDPEFMPRSMESLDRCVHGFEDSQYIIDNSSSESSTNPKTMEVMKSKCFVFHSDYFPRGHANTMSDEWLKENRTDSLRPISCIEQDFYEPYVVLPWCPTEILNHDNMNSYPKPSDPWTPLSPYYDERFYGYGKNKIQNILHLQQKGYKFSVIPALGFLTHHPHPFSNAKERWKERSKHHDDRNKLNIKTEMRNLLKKYKGELRKEYRGKVKLLTKACPAEEKKKGRKDDTKDRSSFIREHGTNSEDGYSGSDVSSISL